MTDPFSRSEPTQALNDLVNNWMEEQRKIASVEAERLGQELAAALATVRAVRDELEVARVEIDTAWKQIARFRRERDKAESACIAAERALKEEKEAHDAARVTFAKVVEQYGTAPYIRHLRETLNATIGLSEGQYATLHAALFKAERHVCGQGESPSPPPSALAQALSEVLNETRGSLSGEQYARLQKAIEDAKPTPAARTLAWLTQRAHENACAKGWWDGTSPDARWNDPGTVPRQLALIHSEVSEALEAWRENDAGSTTPDGKPDGFIAELADVVIRVFDTAGALGMNLEKAVLEKMAFNATRPYKHGGKRA